MPRPLTLGHVQRVGESADDLGQRNPLWVPAHRAQYRRSARAARSRSSHGVRAMTSEVIDAQRRLGCTARHALSRHDRRYRPVLPRLGVGGPGRLRPRLGTELRHVGVPAPRAGRPRSAMRRLRPPRVRALGSARRRLRLRHPRRRPRRPHGPSGPPRRDARVALDGQRRGRPVPDAPRRRSRGARRAHQPDAAVPATRRQQPGGRRPRGLRGDPRRPARRSTRLAEGARAGRPRSRASRASRCRTH